MAEWITYPNQFRVYKPPRAWQRRMRSTALIFPVFLLMVALAAVNSIGDDLAHPIESIGLVFFLLYWGFVCVVAGSNSVYQWFAGSQMRIVASDEVVEFHTYGYSVIGAWTNVSGITTLTRGKHAVECLMFQRCTITGSRLWVWLLTGNLAFVRAIPIGDFGDWRNSDFADELRAYVQNGQILLPPKGQQRPSQSRDDLIQAHLEDFLANLTNPAKRRIPRR